MQMNMNIEEITAKAKTMEKTDSQQFVGEFVMNGRKFVVYLTDKFIANRHKFHVFIDGTMSRYTSKFNDKFFNDVELAFSEREDNE